MQSVTLMTRFTHTLYNLLALSNRTIRQLNITTSSFSLTAMNLIEISLSLSLFLVVSLFVLFTLSLWPNFDLDCVKFCGSRRPRVSRLAWKASAQLRDAEERSRKEFQSEAGTRAGYDLIKCKQNCEMRMGGEKKRVVVAALMEWILA